METSPCAWTVRWMHAWWSNRHAIEGGANATRRCDATDAPRPHQRECRRRHPATRNVGQATQNGCKSKTSERICVPKHATHAEPNTTSRMATTTTATWTASCSSTTTTSGTTTTRTACQEPTITGKDQFCSRCRSKRKGSRCCDNAADENPSYFLRKPASASTTRCAFLRAANACTRIYCHRCRKRAVRGPSVYPRTTHASTGTENDSSLWIFKCAACTACAGPWCFEPSLSSIQPRRSAVGANEFGT